MRKCAILNPFNSSVVITVCQTGMSDPPVGQTFVSVPATEQAGMPILPHGIEIYDLQGNVVNKPSVFDFVESTSLVKGGKDATAAPIEQCGEAEKSPLIREMSEGQRVYIWHPDQSIASGIYLVKARTEDGRTITKRVVYLR